MPTQYTPALVSTDPLKAGSLYHLVLGDGTTGAALVEHPLVGLIHFTGSVATGRKVGATAGARLVPCFLELGGKDPAYVRPDANFEHAVENLVDGAFFNSGQSCCGIERIYVQRQRFDDFLERALAWLGQLRLGNPTDPATTLGPLVRPAAARQLARMYATVAGVSRNLASPMRLEPHNSESFDVNTSSSFT